MNSTQSPFEQQSSLPEVQSIIAIGSGKGGVGKSTIASHIAMALAKNFKVGLLDADFYGPSIPRLFGAINQVPDVDPETKEIFPIIRYNIKLMSLGFMVPETSAAIWRGPMLFKAIDQLLHQVKWAPLDYLIIDLPPGTGDVQLSLAQKVPITGAVNICTPQDMALSDVKKSIDMFEQLNIPVIGIIENMSYLLHPSTGEKIQLFPKGGLDHYLSTKKLKKISTLPFHPSLGIACESGIPLLESHPTSPESKLFEDIASTINEFVSK